MATYLAESSSDCCGAPVRVEGRTTHYHACMRCGKACDLAARELAAEALELAEMTLPAAMEAWPDS